MSLRTRNIIIIIAALLAVAGVGYLSYTTQTRSTQSGDEAAIKATVMNFGNYLKSIPLTEPTEDLRRDIQQNYAPYVTDALLQQWRANPAQAPGRTASSPWPDHVVIDQVVTKGQSYMVLGTIVMYSSASLASGTASGKVPFIAQMIKENGEWKIAALQISQAMYTAPGQMPHTPSSTPKRR